MTVLSKNRTLLYAVFLGTKQNDGKLASDVGERVLSQFIYGTVKEKIENQNGQNDAKEDTPSNDDDDDRILKCMDAVIELFATGRKDQDEFLTACEMSFPDIEKLITALKGIPKSVNTIHSRCSKIKIITSVVGILATIALAISCPPLAAAASVSATGVFVAGTGSVENYLLETKRKKAIELVDEIQIRFNAIAESFEFPKKLQATFENMIDSKILTEINEDVKIFFDNFFKRDNLTVGQKKEHLKEKVEKWMKQMSADPKISGLDDELRAIVMTFLLVCLIKSSHQFVLNSTHHMLNNVLGKFGGLKTGDFVSEFLVGAEGSMVEPEKVSGCLKQLFVPIANIVKLIGMSTLDTKSSDLAQAINEALPQFETSFAFLKDTYEGLKMIKYMHEDDVITWVNVLVLDVPGNAQEVHIRGAVRPYLSKEAHGCIKLEKLKTEGNNWYVKIPKTYSEQLLKQSSIQIKNQSCMLMK